jgi:hypothetical protein
MEESCLWAQCTLTVVQLLYESTMLHCKKRLTIFLCPARMSLTFFYSACCTVLMPRQRVFASCTLNLISIQLGFRRSHPGETAVHSGIDKALRPYSTACAVPKS